MFLQTKFKNKPCNSETISRVPVSRWESTSLGETCRWTTKIWQFLSQEDKAQMLCNDVDAHKKQRESLSPDDKVQILNKNADAHKKKQESLSPEDKDLLVKNNTAAQHKHHKSLSPDQKAQVLTMNLLNTKNIESHSLLNRKVKLWQLMRLHTKNNMNCFPLIKSKTHGNQGWTTSWLFDRRG